MDNETRDLHFSIQGEFITKVAKEWMFIDLKPYKVVEDLLLSCMTGTDHTQAQLKINVQNILLGRAELRGRSDSDDYGLVNLEDEKDLNDNNIFTAFGDLAQKYREVKKELSEITHKYEDLVECLENWEEDELDTSYLDDTLLKRTLLKIKLKYDPFDEETNTQWNKTYFNTGNSLVDSYIKATKNDVKYGWLDPEGKFYEVEFGEHQAWPYICICDKAESRDGTLRRRVRDSETVDLSHYYNELLEYFEKENHRLTIDSACADFLVHKGWVLLHNPSMGIPVLDNYTIQGLTKAQREFMFDYYMAIDEEKKANELYKDID